MQVADTPRISDRINQAFQAASETTGTSFEYLVRTAERESSMRPDLKATTSSATGLFQFVDQTWLWMMKEEGADLGLSQYSNAITANGNGRYDVADRGLKQEILALRNDPTISSMMAGRLTQKNAAQLTDRIGRAPTDGELYIAHFMGAGGGARLINLAQSSPDASAAQAFPAQASANRSIFYKRDGSARTAGEVYSVLVRDHGRLATAIADASAKLKGSSTGELAASARVAATHAALNSVAGEPGASDTASVRVAQAFAATDGPVSDAPAKPAFDGFRARNANDAFSALLRDDPAARPAAAAVPEAALGYASVATTVSPAIGGQPRAARATESSAAVAPSRPSRIVRGRASNSDNEPGTITGQTLSASAHQGTVRPSRYGPKREVVAALTPAAATTTTAAATPAIQAAPANVMTQKGIADNRPLDLTAFLKYQAQDPASQRPKKPLLPPI